MSAQVTSHSQPTPSPGGPPTADAPPDEGGIAALIRAREQRIARMREQGMDPYPARAERTHTSAEAVEAFRAVEASGAEEGPHDVVVAGRLIGALRLMGGSAFVHLLDGAGQLQLHLRKHPPGLAAFRSRPCALTAPKRGPTTFQPHRT